MTGLRRIQPDAEKHREATLVNVPEPGKGVLALSVPADQLASVTEIVVRVGRQLETL